GFDSHRGHRLLISTYAGHQDRQCWFVARALAMSALYGWCYDLAKRRTTTAWERPGHLATGPGLLR
ncbi:MAG: hypothetical protein ACRDQZ_16005, partial [Mycobacteriales bacterium]